MSNKLADLVGLLSGDEPAKMAEAITQIALVAKESRGVAPTPDENANLGMTRDCVLAGTALDLDVAIQQLRDTPAIMARMESEENQEAVAQAHQQAIAKLSPQDRINYSRKYTWAAAPEDAGVTIEDRLKEMHGMESRTMKHAYARKWGLDRL